MSIGSRPPSLRRIVREFARYFVASGLALAVDVALFRAALGLGLPYPVAALVGFAAGAATAYVASIRWVFTERSQRSAGREFVVFVAIGAVGLLLTEAVLWISVELLHLSPMSGKLLATGLVFLSNFGLRKAMLFTKAGTAAGAAPEPAPAPGDLLA